MTWFLSELAAETLADPSSELLWTLPTERPVRSVRRGETVIAPDTVGELIAGDSHVPFYLECEHRARHPRGVRAKLRPYLRYHRSGEPEEDHPPFPFTLFVVNSEDVEETYVRTTTVMRSRQSAPDRIVPMNDASNTIGITSTAWSRCPWHLSAGNRDAPVPVFRAAAQYPVSAWAQWKSATPRTHTAQRDTPKRAARTLSTLASSKGELLRSDHNQDAEIGTRSSV